MMEAIIGLDRSKKKRCPNRVIGTGRVIRAISRVESSHGRFLSRLKKKVRPSAVNSIRTTVKNMTANHRTATAKGLSN